MDGTSDAPADEEVLALEVFRAGDYGPKGRWDEDAIEAIASSYDPARHEAPATLDHAQDGPAHGWVRRLARIGDRLVATIGGLSPALRALLRDGAYRKRSVELYRAMPPGGAPYLKAVSFLGAAAPEVKGLADPVFAGDAGDAVCFDESIPAPAPGARDRLLAEGRWNPEWDEAGLGPVLDAMAEGPGLAVVEGVLRQAARPVPFGESALDECSVPRMGTEERFAADADPGSVLRHRRAAALQAANPGMGYAEALLRLDR